MKGFDYHKLMHAAVPIFQKYRAVLLIFLIGFVLLAGGRSTSASSEPPPDTTAVAGENFNLEQFEQHLSAQLSAIDGAGRVSLMLSLDQTQEAVYAVNVRRSGSAAIDSTQSYESDLSVLSNGSYGQSPVEVKRLQPVFRGAVVLCDGAEQASVKLAVTQAVQTVCGIGADKVTVLKMADNA